MFFKCNLLLDPSTSFTCKHPSVPINLEKSLNQTTETSKRECTRNWTPPKKQRNHVCCYFLFTRVGPKHQPRPNLSAFTLHPIIFFLNMKNKNIKKKKIDNESIDYLILSWSHGEEKWWMLQQVSAREVAGDQEHNSLLQMSYKPIV